MSVVNATPLLITPEGYQISRSVRLRSSAGAYFNRTLGSNSTSTTKFTWSGWVKRGALGASRYSIFYSGNSGATGGFFEIEFNADTLRAYFDSAATYYLITTQVFRDPSAWYHISVSVDTSQSTASNRVLIYVNGTQVTSFSTASYPTQNYAINNTSGNVMTLGNLSSLYYDGYLTEINFIDGQALTPSSFGETDAVTGVWKPKKYAGTYGTNGFYLNFSDNSAATAAAIGKDYSGNGNNWTPNNISVTSGVTYDSMIDSPTMYADGGNGRGNYPTINSLFNSGLLGTLPLKDANLTGYESSGSAAWRSRWSTIGMSSGKWYAEVTVAYTGASSLVASNAVAIGLHDGGSATYAGQTSTTYGYLAGGTKYTNATSTAYGDTYANGDVIGVAYDADAGTLTFYKNNTSQGVAFTSIPAGLYFFGISTNWVSPDGQTTLYVNFGQRPFAYTPPTGFKALNTFNLPDSTIAQGNKNFNAVTYTGNSGSQTVSNGQFQPDLTWHKTRSASASHVLFDSIRGASSGLNSDLTNAQNTGWTGQAFTSTGFTVSNAFSSESNYNGQTMVAWQWKAGGTVVSNTSGSITSQVSANASAGFSVVTYTGTGANATVGHGLGVAPKMVIVKLRSGAGENWNCWHTSLGSNAYRILLNTTAAVDTTSPTVWNSNINPTSTTFSIGTATATNGSASTYVAYCWSEVAGYSKFGSYTGNGSTDGPFVYCGFRPKFVMIKNIGGVSNWYVYDSSRDTYNVMGNGLYPNLSNAESGSTIIDFLSNGFKIRTTATDLNTNGNSMIFACFAENPFKNSLAR